MHNMDKNGVITFSEWYNGMAEYPLQGTGLLMNVDVVSNAGIVSISPKATLSFTPNGIPVAEVIYGSDTYTLTDNGANSALYKNGTEIISSFAQGKDLLLYKDYLLVFYGNSIGAYGPLSSSVTWWPVLTGTSSTGTLNSQRSAYYTKALYGQDDIVYITAGPNIMSLSFSSYGTTFVEPTVVFNEAALDLPAGHYATTLAEIGKFLAIGTQTGSSWTDTSYAGRVYLWDRVSSSVRMPVIFNENRVHLLYSHANKLYVVAGSNGNVYVTDGANFSKIRQIPFTSKTNATTLKCYPNAINLTEDGRLLIGTSTGNDSFPNSLSKHGVWEIDITNSKYPTSLKQTISTGDFGSDEAFYIGFIGANGRIGWQTGSTYGVDYLDTHPYDSYGGVIQTQLKQVGTNLQKKSFTHVEFTLAEPLVSGQGIRISYRKNLFDDFTTIGTWSYSTHGGVISVEDKALIADAEFIQLQIELDQNASVSVVNNINLIKVMLW